MDSLKLTSLKEQIEYFIEELKTEDFNTEM